MTTVAHNALTEKLSRDTIYPVSKETKQTLLSQKERVENIMLHKGKAGNSITIFRHPGAHCAAYITRTQ